MAGDGVVRLDQRVEALLACGQPKEAVAACDEAQAGAYELLLAGVALSDAGEHDGAVRTLRRAAERMPNSRTVLTQLGSALENAGFLTEAIDIFERVVEIPLSTEDAEDGVEEVWGLTNLGVSYSRAGRLDEALETLKRAVESDPTYEEAHLNLGVVYSKLDRPSKAEDHTRIALRLDPKYAYAHHNLGRFLREREQDEEALAHFKRAWELKPDFGLAHSEYGQLLLDLKPEREKEAVRHLKHAAGDEEPDVWAFLYLSHWHYRHDRLDESLRCAHRALEISPEEPAALLRAACVLEARRQWDQAIPLCETALTLAPGSTQAMESLANCWTLKGDLKRARHYLDQAAAEPGEKSRRHQRLQWALEERETQASADEWAELADEDLKPVKRKW